MNAAEEARHLAAVARELERTFPTIAPERVRSTVQQTWMQYLEAPVRDFVPLLVRREAVAQLRLLA
jgi:hypothetical protein